MDQSVNGSVVARAAAAQRLDLYAPIHKAMRMCIVDALLRVGRMDPSNPRELAEALACCRAMLGLCSAHLEHENRFMHAAMEARLPGSASRAADDHVGHVQAIEGLHAELDALEQADASERPRAALGLYRHLALFAAENFEHMQHEETHNMGVLWSCYEDTELLAIHDALLAAIEPAKMAAFLRWIIPAIDHGERVGMLTGMRETAPPGAFAGALAIAREHLEPAEYRALEAALEVRKG